MNSTNENEEKSQNLLQKIMKLIPLNEQAELKEKINNLSFINKLQPNSTKTIDSKNKYDIYNENFCLKSDNTIHTNMNNSNFNEISNKIFIRVYFFK